jgi:predicted dehydrogenase
LGSDEIGLALIGCGGFAPTLARAIDAAGGARLVSCFDVDEKARRRRAAEFRCREASSYEEVLGIGDVDGVVLATPNAVHAEQGIAAARAGKHVFCEKPIANVLDDARRLIDACDREGVVLMVGHFRRRLAAAREAAGMIEAGDLGVPVLAEGTVTNGQGFELSPGAFRWRGDDSGCPGGSLMTLGIHAVDVFRSLLGPIDRVAAMAAHLAIPAAVEDVNTTICRFRCGALGSIATSYATTRLNRIRISGTEGSLEWATELPDLPSERFFEALFDVDRFTPLVHRPGGGDPRRVILRPGNPYVEEIEEFVHCLRTGARPETDGAGALAALAYVRAAIESADAGEALPVTEG